MFHTNLQIANNAEKYRKASQMNSVLICNGKNKSFASDLILNSSFYAAYTIIGLIINHV